MMDHIIAGAITLKMLLGEKKVDAIVLTKLAHELDGRGWKSEAEVVRVISGAMIAIVDYEEEE